MEALRAKMATMELEAEALRAKVVAVETERDAALASLAEAEDHARQIEDRSIARPLGSWRDGDRSLRC